MPEPQTTRSTTELPKPPANLDHRPQYAFHMRVLEIDQSGYYHSIWSRATPLVVHATDRDEAFRKCFAVMGDPPRGRGWTWSAKIDKITEVQP